MGKKTVAITAILLLGATVSAVTVDQEFLKLQDDEDLSFGTDNDFSLRYDSSNTQFELYDDRQDLNLLAVPENSPVQLNTDLDLNQADITNVGLIDGVNITDHSARHEEGGSDEINVQGLTGVLSHPQKPKIHGNEKHLENYTTTNTDLEAFSTNSTDNQVPVSQGNGELQMVESSKLGQNKEVKLINDSVTTQGEDTLIINELPQPYSVDDTIVSSTGEQTDIIDASQINEIQIEREGELLYVLSDINDRVEVYEFGEVDELSTLSFVDSYTFSEVNNYEDIEFENPQGSNMQMYISGNDYIYQYELSTDYDLTTATYIGQMSDAGASGDILGISIVGAGNKLYVAGSFSGDPAVQLKQYNLGNSYDISSSSLANEWADVMTLGYPTTDVTWNEAGTQIQIPFNVDGFTTDSGIYYHSLSTPYEYNGERFDGFTNYIGMGLNTNISTGYSWGYEGRYGYVADQQSQTINQFKSGEGVTSVTLSQDDNVDEKIINIKDGTGRASESNVIVNSETGDIDGRNNLALTSDGEAWQLQNFNGEWYRVGGE